MPIHKYTNDDKISREKYGNLRNFYRKCSFQNPLENKFTFNWRQQQIIWKSRNLRTQNCTSIVVFGLHDDISNLTCSVLVRQLKTITVQHKGCLPLISVVSTVTSVDNNYFETRFVGSIMNKRNVRFQRKIRSRSCSTRRGNRSIWITDGWTWYNERNYHTMA